MGVETMGKVLVTATIENLSDVLDVEKGRLAPDQVRRVEIDDALIDTGATSLCMPRRLIEQLGLTPIRTRTARTSAGIVPVQIYGTARLTIQGRECRIDVTGLPDECPVLIGQVPLDLMDWVVDPGRQRLIGNPAHGGEQMIEIY
ncbi:MAG TPA: retroviral-like aspartic protease family protein [Isosphaeraceae bacterium]